MEANIENKIEKIEKVDNIYDALKWFEQEVEDGKCDDPDCPFCNAFEYALSALHIMIDLLENGLLEMGSQDYLPSRYLVKQIFKS